MHIKIDLCENIINTITNVSGKATDNANDRLNLEELCMRDELHLCTRKNGNSYKPKAMFILLLEQKKSLCEGLHILTLPDGYSVIGIIITLWTRFCLVFLAILAPNLFKLGTVVVENHHSLPSIEKLTGLFQF